MNLQKEQLELRLGHYVHQDHEGHYLLSEDDLTVLSTPQSERTFKALAIGAAASVILGIVLQFHDKLFG